MGMYRGVRVAVVLVCGAVAGAVVGCSSSGGGGGGSPATTSITLNANLPASASGISIAAGNSQQITSVYTVPATIGPVPVTDVTVDMAATVAGSSVSFKASPKPGGPAGARGAAGASVATMTGWIGPAAMGASVCGTGFEYGPFAVTDDGAGGVAVDPPGATAGRQTLSVINTGSLAICILIQADQDLDVDADKVALELTMCDEDAKAMGGDWSGTYTCNNHGGAADEAGDVFIVLNQGPGSYSASYGDDGGGEFSGTVCDSQFKFDGGYGDAVDESGVFTLTGPGKAKKHSEWHSNFDASGGVCDDVLTQIAAF